MMQSTTVLCPFTPRISPHADAVQRWSLHWATRHGLLDRPGARAAFARARFGNLMARVYPDCGPVELRLAADWLVTIFALDDLLERAGDEANAGAVVSGVIDLLMNGGNVQTPQKGHEKALVDVWRRTKPRVSEGWRGRFVRHVSEYLQATVWEAGNRAAGKPPSVAEYRTMRYRTAAIDMFFDLIEPMHGVELADGALEDPDFAAMRWSAGMITALFNDIVSWPKEAAAGDHHNIVLVLRHERGLTFEQAVEAAVAEHDALVLRFLEVRQRYHRGSWPADPAVALVAADLVHWIRGNVDWSMESGRYTPSEAAVVPQQRRPNRQTIKGRPAKG